MPVLSIRQEKDLTAKVEFEGGEWMVEFHNPFTAAQEEELGCGDSRNPRQRGPGAVRLSPEFRRAGICVRRRGGGVTPCNGQRSECGPVAFWAAAARVSAPDSVV